MDYSHRKPYLGKNEVAKNFVFSLALAGWHPIARFFLSELPLILSELRRK